MNRPATKTMTLAKMNRPTQGVSIRSAEPSPNWPPRRLRPASKPDGAPIDPPFGTAETDAVPFALVRDDLHAGTAHDAPHHRPRFRCISHQHDVPDDRGQA